MTPSSTARRADFPAGRQAKESNPFRGSAAASSNFTAPISCFTPPLPPLPPLPAATDDVLGWAPGGWTQPSAAPKPAGRHPSDPAMDPSLWGGFSQQLCDAYGIGSVSHFGC